MQFSNRAHTGPAETASREHIEEDALSEPSSSMTEEQINVDDTCAANDVPYQPDSSSISTQQLKTKTLKFQQSWFQKYPWLSYIPDRQGVVCFYCRKSKESNMPSRDVHAEETFTTTGFRNWKKGIEKFDRHQMSNYHREALKHFSSRSELPILSHLNTAKTEQQAYARRMLVKIISSLRYLSRQGLALRGADDESGNFMTLLRLRQEDCRELTTWLQRHNSFTSPAIQNEIVQLMAHTVVPQLVNKINSSGQFSIIVDGTQDVNHKEQESICIRFVTGELEPEEKLLGLYNTPSTTGKDLAAVILDVLMRLGLPGNCIRDQAYRGAVNMAGVHNEAIIRDKYPLALYVHCGSH